MSDPPYDLKAAKQTVSISLNSDLYAKAKTLGINTSKVAELALAEEYAKRRREALRNEVRQDLAALEAYAGEHGSFADLVRRHYEPGSAADGVASDDAV